MTVFQTKTGLRMPLNTTESHQHKAEGLYLLSPSENKTEDEVKAGGSNFGNCYKYRLKTVKKMQFCSLIPHFIAASCSPTTTDGMKPAQLVMADNIEQSQTWSGEPWLALWQQPIMTAFKADGSVFWFYTPVRALAVLFLAKCIWHINY